MAEKTILYAKLSVFSISNTVARYFTTTSSFRYGSILWVYVWKTAFEVRTVLASRSVFCGQENMNSVVLERTWRRSVRMSYTWDRIQIIHNPRHIRAHIPLLRSSPNHFKGASGYESERVGIRRRYTCWKSCQASKQHQLWRYSGLSRGKGRMNQDLRWQQEQPSRWNRCPPLGHISIHDQEKCCSITYYCTIYRSSGGQCTVD